MHDSLIFIVLNDLNANKSLSIHIAKWLSADTPVNQVTHTVSASSQKLKASYVVKTVNSIFFWGGG